ncbi:three-Cys-motif partner protein TcmP [Salinarchaeum laminariae]|uniref:three-Cys-motif partner protein TcmP n=1 Tax=Salinarchaeum laminariae TaxID=869888 RepID=UPI0020BF930F|nr:three-Cys-motif partner protein TcmP [Salinarchaeum laminariae]
MSNTYSGDKSIAKLVILQKYLWAYKRILDNNWEQDLWYVDTHAGNGVTELPDYRLNIAGSPIRALEYDFDAYYLYEIDSGHWQSLCDAIEERLGIELSFGTLDTGEEYAIRGSDPRILIHNMDSMDGVDWLIENGNSYKHWFTFVDPEGLNDLEWDLLRKLINRGNTDILYNFQTSGIVRNSTDGAEHAHQALEDAVGEDVPRNRSQDFYVQWFRENKIEPLDYHTASRKMTSRGSSNWRYDLIFASGNETAVNNVMEDIMQNEDTLRADVVEEIQETRERANDPQGAFDSRLRFEEHGSESEMSQSGLYEY